MTYFISLSEVAQWIKVKCPTMKYETLIKKLKESGLHEFTVIFRDGRVWDCMMTRFSRFDHNWRHLVVENIKHWKKEYNRLLKEKLLTTEQFDEINFTGMQFKL